MLLLGLSDRHAGQCEDGCSEEEGELMRYGGLNRGQRCGMWVSPHHPHAEKRA